MLISTSLIASHTVSVPVIGDVAASSTNLSACLIEAFSTRQSDNTRTVTVLNLVSVVTDKYLYIYMPIQAPTTAHLFPKLVEDKDEVLSVCSVL